MIKLFYFPLILLSIFGFCQHPDIETGSNRVVLKYKEKKVFSCILTKDQSYTIHQETGLYNDAPIYIITIRANNLQSFECTGEILGSDESIACESEPADEGLKVVRHTVGKSYSLLNNAVYDRSSDWLLSLDKITTRVHVIPNEDNKYQIQAKGFEIIIRFRPDYYRKFRGLPYFNPSTYSVWKKPVTGWCSWFAYFDQITENDIHQTADVLAEKLKPYGLDYLQIDDGYEQTPIGLPETWLHPNTKFPSGLKSLAGYIQSKGLVPGIWTNVSFADSVKAFQNKQLFVQNSKGEPASGNWIGYIMDGSKPATKQELLIPVYKELNREGWQYFKLDALRHLKYEGYNSNKKYFAIKQSDRNEAFRSVVRTVRQEIGKDHFLLACWGIRPELTGLVDGCRIGNDGYSYAGLAQFNSYNNIFWRNDPDHIVLSEKEAFRSCTATSLTGSVFMLTDKPEKYQNRVLLEAAKRSIPILYTQPGQVYDVDPSRSSLIGLADMEMSGSGPRPFDASTTTTTGLFSLEINKSFENWLVLGRLDERDKMLQMKDLGLDEKKEYQVFEFWTKKYMGSFIKQFEPGPIDSIYHCQVFCFREKKDHPQVIATNRHISCGGVDLQEVDWKGNNLKGKSLIVPGDEYALYIFEPDQYSFNKVITNTEVTILSNEKTGNIRRIVMRSLTAVNINWEIVYN